MRAQKILIIFLSWSLFVAVAAWQISAEAKCKTEGGIYPVMYQECLGGHLSD